MKNDSQKNARQSPENIDQAGKQPVHIGIILDGNRRWAKSRRLPTFEGHRRGLDNVRKIAKEVFARGIKIMTVFAFSTENWHRDPAEVSYLLGLFKRFIDRETKALLKNGIKLKFFGRRNDFDKETRLAMKRAEQATRLGKKGQLNVCLSYGGRDEIVRAVRKIAASGKRAGEINEDLISARLDSAGLPDPDLIIRTSGEQRLSGFLTWQAVYSEIYFTHKHWPAFKTADLKAALDDYARRQRRFGAN